MTDTFRILSESYKIYRVYCKLYRKGILKKMYTLSEVFEGVKKQKELVANG